MEHAQRRENGDRRERWGIAAGGGEFDTSEVETEAAAVEVVISWGDDGSILHVAHLSPPRDVVIGEGDGLDYLVGAELLGPSRLPVVRSLPEGIACVVPAGAHLEVVRGGQTLDAGELESALAPDAELAGARRYLLAPGARARVSHRGLVFHTRSVAAGRRVAPPPLRWRQHGWVGLSLAVHALVLGVFYFSPPSSSALSLDRIDASSRAARYVVTRAEALVEEPTLEPSSDPGTGESGARAPGEEGAAGEPEARPSRGRMAVRGSDQEVRLPREEARQTARDMATIGVLRQMTASWDGPSSPFGADQAMGMDPESAIGALMGDQIGSNFGFGGLGPRGTGRGGGGDPTDTVGLDRLGTRTGLGPNGYGRTRDLPAPDRGPRVPPRITGRPQAVGALSAEAIRRVVQRHINEVRFCYEQGLAQRPDLEGRVTVQWTIAPSGAVQSSSLASTTLGEARVEQCIVGAVRRWSFPSPEDGGVVGVSYPFLLQTP